MGDYADLGAEMGGSRSEEVNGFRLFLERLVTINAKLAGPRASGYPAKL
jgi:hypothetical protein